MASTPPHQPPPQQGTPGPSASARGVPPLPRPGTAEGERGLGALLADPARAVVGLDFDGTLAEIVPDPEQARAHPRAVPALAALAPHVASIVVVTGRPAEVAVRHGGFADVPGLDGLVVLGHYGAERWDAATGEVRTPPAHPGVDAVRAELPRVVEETGPWPGAWIEDKGHAVALHVRRAEEPAAAFEALRGPLAELAERSGLVLEPGRMVLELRPPGMDKGVALRGFVGEAGARSVLYAGDDLGDLPAFDAVDALRAEGVPGLLVCSGTTDVPEVAGRADLRLEGPGAVADLLAALAAAVS